ncbi:MAG: glycine cleavage T C-terminal barrel domain-containing protein [Amphiplicatus sp.]
MIFPADDPFTDDPRPTALYAASASAASANSWTSVNGFAVARAYTSVLDEYEAALDSACVADVGAVTRYTARGRGAAALIARATTAPVETLAIGESARGLILDAGGYAVDKIEAAKLGPDLYLLSTSRPQARRLQLAARGFEAEIDDITGQIAALAILGPEARDIAAAAGLDAESDMLARQGRVRGVETSARPIHFGALAGIEVIYPYDEALTVWERLRRARAPKPMGLDALEIFRIEGGAPRPGLDFISADDAASDSDKRLPDEIGLAHLAPANRAWFNGRRALVGAVRAGRALAVLALDAGEAEPGAAVYGKKGQVGTLTSAAYSPRLKRVIAFADLAVEAFGKPLEVALPGGERRVAAAFFETPEGKLAQAFRASMR